MADNTKPQQPKPGSALANFQEFDHELRSRDREIMAQLPRHVSPARFFAVAMSAVKQNPDLLKCSPRSLFTAITKAAQDGLLPDGREGVIVSYNTKIKKKVNGEIKEEWIPTAQWNPMAHGLRKRAKELDGIQIDAQAVYQNDTDGRGMIWEQGDEPRIVHTPPPLGQPRGALIGAYAIFKTREGVVVHREVMSADQIEKTRNQSKAKDSLMWTKFVEEGYRKTVLRRGIKSVPVSEELETIARRDDESFDFTTALGDSSAAAPATIGQARPDAKDFKGGNQNGTPSDGVIIEGDSEEIVEDEGDQGNSQTETKKTDTRPAEVKKPEEVKPKADPRPEPPAEQEELAESDDPEREPQRSEGFRQGEQMLAKMKSSLDAGEIKLADLWEQKKAWRTAIDSLERLDDDEKDMLRGQFSQMILEAERAMKKSKGKTK